MELLGRLAAVIGISLALTLLLLVLYQDDGMPQVGEAGPVTVTQAAASEPSGGTP